MITNYFLYLLEWLVFVFVGVVFGVLPGLWFWEITQRRRGLRGNPTYEQGANY